MPIYKENRANPNAIYFESSSLGWVYFEDKLVWQRSGWELIAEFVCNPTGGEFGFSYAGIYKEEGEYKWEVNGIETAGEYIEFNIDETEKSVKLWGRGVCKVLSIEMYCTDIIGVLNLSNNAFRYSVSFYIIGNQLMDELILPNVLYNATNTFQINDAGIESLDISMMTSWSILEEGGYSYLSIEDCESLTTIFLPNEFSGIINGVSIRNTAVYGVLDISMFVGFEGYGVIEICDNPQIIGIILPEIEAGTNKGIDYLRIINNDNLEGVIDASVIRFIPVNLSYLAGIEIYDNPKITGITFSETARAIHRINLSNNDISGTIDLSMFSVINEYLLLHGNIHLTGINLGTASGLLHTCSMYGCNISGTIDLSRFDWYISSTIHIYSMPLLTGILFKHCNGGIGSVLIYGNTTLGYINIYDLYDSLRTGNNLLLDMKDNNWDVAIINRILKELNTVNIAPFIPTPPFSKTIDLSGTNAAPDSSSGGYNGTAAKASLQSKGFTVLTN